MEDDWIFCRPAPSSSSHPSSCHTSPVKYSVSGSHQTAYDYATSSSETAKSISASTGTRSMLMMSDIYKERRGREFQAVEERIVSQIDRFVNHAGAQGHRAGGAISAAAKRAFMTSIHIELRELLRRTIDNEQERDHLLELLAQERSKVQDLVLEKTVLESNKLQNQAKEWERSIGRWEEEAVKREERLRDRLEDEFKKRLEEKLEIERHRWFEQTEREQLGLRGELKKRFDYELQQEVERLRLSVTESREDDESDVQKVYEEALSRLRSETKHVHQMLSLEVKVLRSTLKLKTEKINQLKDLNQQLQKELKAAPVYSSHGHGRGQAPSSDYELWQRFQPYSQKKQGKEETRASNRRSSTSPPPSSSRGWKPEKARGSPSCLSSLSSRESVFD